MLLAHVVFCVPYVIFSVLPSSCGWTKPLWAALDLARPPSHALRRVILPQIMPGVITAGLLAFTLSIDDFVISFFTTGRRAELSILIFSSARMGN